MAKNLELATVKDLYIDDDFDESRIDESPTTYRAVIITLHSPTVVHHCLK